MTWAAVWMRALETAHLPNEKGCLSPRLGDGPVRTPLFWRPVD
jgi:hypothetical protein